MYDYITVFKKNKVNGLYGNYIFMKKRIFCENVEYNIIAIHWANADIIDMTSRLIIEGVENSNFGPDTYISRYSQR